MGASRKKQVLLENGASKGLTANVRTDKKKK